MPSTHTSLVHGLPSLQSRGELRPLVASQHFKEHLGDDLEASAKRYAKMAVEQLRQQRE
jgi:hypothetical protein